MVYSLFNSKVAVFFSTLLLSPLIFAQSTTISLAEKEVMMFENDQVQLDNILSAIDELFVGNEKINNNAIVAKLSKRIFDLASQKIPLLVNISDSLESDQVFVNRPLILAGKIDDNELQQTLTDLYHIAVVLALPENDYFSNIHYRSPTLIKQLETALNLILEKYYLPESQHTGNWWNWEIGANKTLLEIAVVTRDLVAKETINQALKVSYAMSPNPEFIFNSQGTDSNREKELSLGANRIDLIWIALLRASLNKNVAELESSIQKMDSLFTYTMQGDGFYADGGIIQHTDIPYIGGYGSELLTGFINIFYVLSKSSIAFDAKNTDFIFSTIFDSFSPVLFKSQLVENMRGRASSRGWITGRKEAQGIIQSLLILQNVAPKKYKTRLAELLKHHLLSPDAGRDSYFIEQYANIILALDSAQKLLQDDSIAVATGLEGNYLFASMDRVIHRTKDWLFSVSAYSNRTANYECINNENLYGFNTSNGMTYLYDQDQEQYVNYWPMLDPVLPVGTTFDKAAFISPCQAMLSKKNRQQEMKWVGGVSTRETTNDMPQDVGTFGMNFVNPEMGIHAKKSWFMFDNEILALGSDISQSNSMATAVEFRKIKSTAGNQIVTDGKLHPVGLTAIDLKDSFNWIFVEGDIKSASRGYIFPSFAETKEKQQVTLSRQLRANNHKSWANINQFNLAKMSGLNVSYNTVSIEIDHQMNDNYAYIILPSTELAKVAAYAAKPEIRIIENSPSAHVAHHTSLNIFAANIWHENGHSSDAFSINKSASLIYKIEQDFLHVWISNPERDAKTVELEFPHLTAFADLVTKSKNAVKATSSSNFAITFHQDDANTIYFAVPLSE